MTTTDDRPVATSGSPCSTSFDGDAWRPSSRDIPVKQRADGAVAAAAGPRPHGPATERRRGHRRGQRRTSSRAGCRRRTRSPRSTRRATGATTARTLDFISAADGPDDRRPDLRRSSALDLDPDRGRARRRDARAGVGLHPQHRAPPRPARRRCDARRAGHRGQRDSKFEQAVALQQWFRARRRLPLLPRPCRPGNGTDDLVSSSAPARTAGSATASSSPPRWR